MKRNKYYLLMLSVMLILVLGMVMGCSSSPTSTTAPPLTKTETATATTTVVAEKVFKLTFQGKWVGLEKQGWAAAQLKLTDQVKAATKGRIIITNVNEIVSDANVLDGVRTGVLDIAVQGLHSRGELALQNFISLPFVSFPKLYDLLQQAEPVTIPAWDALGVKGLGYNVFLPQFIFTSKPCATFNDLTSAKLRLTGTIISDMVSKAGGHPITMENDAVYQAIQRGTIDGAQTALGGYIGNSWYEVAKYISAWPVGCNSLGIIMNKDVWNELGPDLQKILLDTIAQEEKDQFQAAVADIDGLLKTAMEKGSVRQDPTQAEIDKLMAYVGPAVADWKAKAGEAKANEVMAIVNKVLGTKY